MTRTGTTVRVEALVVLTMLWIAAIGAGVVMVTGQGTERPSPRRDAGPEALWGGPAAPGVAGPDGGGRLPVAETAIDNGLSILTDPDRSWELDAEEILPHGSFISTSPYADGPEIPPVIAGDVVVTAVRASKPEEMRLVGVDASSGEVLWSRETDAPWFPSCSALAHETVVACWGWGDDEEPVKLFDPSSGRERGALIEGGVADVVADGDSGLVIELTSTQDLVVTRVGVPSGAKEWRRTYPLPPTEELTHGYSARLSDGVLEVSFSSTTWMVDAQSGQLLDSGGPQHRPLGGGFALDGSSRTSRVIDDEGNVFLRSREWTWYGDTTAWGAVFDGRIGFGRAVYDIASGQQLWERSDLAEDATLRWTPDGRQVVAFDAGSMQMLAAETGESLGPPQDDVDTDKAYTRDAVVVTSTGATSFLVLSREDGSVSWEGNLDLPGSTEYGVVDFAVTSSALVAVQDKTMSGWAGFSSGTDGEDSTEATTDYVTDCGSEPEFVPVSSRTASGGLEVTFEVTAVCPTGQWLSSQAMTVGMDGDASFATGTFDFSDDPVWIPEGGTTMRLVYPASGVYATQDEIADGISGETIRVECECEREPGSVDGEVPISPDYGSDPAQPVLAVDSGLSEEDAEESALEALRRIAAADDGSVESSLAGTWVPQLSSKVRGTTDDGISYDYSDILAEHLRLRLRYADPGVRLLNSRDWGSFLGVGYWVTVVESPSTDPAPALGFCRDQGFDRDHCYAKRLLREGSPEGSTRLLP